MTLKCELTQWVSISSISGCQIKGRSLDKATHVFKQSSETRSYATNGAACAMALKSRPVRDPEYCTSVWPAKGEIQSPKTSNEESQVAKRFFFSVLLPSWFCTRSRHRYLTNPNKMMCKISTGVSWCVVLPQSWPMFFKKMRLTY